MAEDLGNDPQYQQLRDDLANANKRKGRWLSWNISSSVLTVGLIGAVLLEIGALGVEVGTLGLGTPVALAMAVAGVALFGFSAYAKHKYYEASKDEAMAHVEANAQRTSYYVGKTLAQQKQQDFYADAGTGTKFQDMVNAKQGRGPNVVTH